MEMTNNDDTMSLVGEVIIEQDSWFGVIRE